MVQGTKLKHSIWVIHPARLWCDVELRVLCSCLVQGESETCSSTGSRNLSQQSATTCSQQEALCVCVCNACSSTEGKSTRRLTISDAQARVGTVQRAEGCCNTLSSSCIPQYEGTWAGLRTKLSWQGTMTDRQRLQAGIVSIENKRESHWHPPREHEQASKSRHKRHNCLQMAEEERTYVSALQ